MRPANVFCRPHLVYRRARPRGPPRDCPPRLNAARAKAHQSPREGTTARRVCVCRGLPVRRKNFTRSSCDSCGGDLARHDAVALARRGFEPARVEEGYSPPLVTYEPGLAHPDRERGDARARHAEHVGEELLRELERVGAGAVARDEEPVCESLLDGVEAVAGGRLRYLRQEPKRVAQQKLAQ